MVMVCVVAAAWPQYDQQNIKELVKRKILKQGQHNNNVGLRSLLSETTENSILTFLIPLILILTMKIMFQFC